VKKLRKGSVGVSRDSPNFLRVPLLFQERESYGFQIWPLHSERPSELRPIKNFGKKERGRIQGLPVFSGTPYYLRNG